MLFRMVKIALPVLLFSLFLIAPQTYGEVGPMEVVRSGVDRVLSILKDCKPGETFKVNEHREELKKIVSEYFDFDEMSVRVLGRHVQAFTPEQRAEFKELFRELLFDTYINRYGNYECGKVEVIYESESVREPYASVKTVVKGYKDADVVAEYRLKKRPQGWKIYDVVIEGVSLIQNYRTQFNDILVKESSEQLLKRLRQKVHKG